MTEGEFIRFYKKRNKNKTHEEVKEKIDLFWNTILKALDEDKNKKVTLKNWGSFEKRKVNPRKIVIPLYEKATYTKAKEVIKFRAGKGLQGISAGVDVDE